MDGVIERLRAKHHRESAQYVAGSNILAEAADEIERLREALGRVSDENRRLRKRNSTLAGMAGSDGMSPRVQRRYGALRKATGGLPPELVAKALAVARDDDAWRADLSGDYFTPDEEAALRAATFEVPA